MNWRLWALGILHAAISGAANAGAAIAVDPAHFNFGEGFLPLLKMAGAGAIIGAIMYLRNSPLPAGWDGMDRRGGAGGTVAVILLSAVLALGLAACGQKRVAHPGEIDAFDGSTYDVLLSFQGALDQAQREIAAGNLPASHKGFVNVAGTGYNVLREAWLGYRAVKLLPDCTPEQVAAGAISGCKTGNQVTDAIAKVNVALPAAHNFIAQLVALVRGKPAPAPPSPELLEFQTL